MSSTSIALALPAHLVSSPWLIMDRSDYFFVSTTSSTPMLSDDQVPDSGDDDDNKENVRPFKTFPITPSTRAQHLSTTPPSLNLSLPALCVGRRTFAAPPQPRSAPSTVVPLTPPASPRPDVDTQKPQCKTKVEAHHVPLRSVSPYRERSWESYFSGPVELNVGGGGGKLKLTDEVKSEWVVDSVQLWLRH